MAAFAIAAELPPMYIGMAIRAVRAYVFEDQAGMAAGASHFLMHAAQRIASLIVIEFRIGADWPPTCVSVAILTGN